MEWIQQFRWLFLLPLGFFTVLFIGGYWSDHGRYPWKYWTREQTIGGFAIGPAVSLFITSISMLRSFENQPFVFERWFTALCFGLFSAYLFSRIPLFAKGYSKEEEKRIRLEWEAAHPGG